MRILGIDPGSRQTGFGIVEQHADKMLCLTNGCIRVQDVPLAARLRQIHDGFCELIEQFSPEFVSIERVFVHRNVDSALKLGHARGAALTAVAISVPVAESPMVVTAAALTTGVAP